MSQLPADQLAEVDRLVQAQQLPQAAQLLEHLLKNYAGDVQHWLHLAGLRRALRQPHRALEAVHQALALSPSDFMALVMRASLLERMQHPTAGIAWKDALALCPAENIPPPLAAALEQGRAFLAQWEAQRSERLQQATAQAEANCDEEDARWRIARFRSNVLGLTKVYHSTPTHFHYPGLEEREYHPRRRFPWLAEVEAAAPAIRAELEALMQSQRAELVPYIQYGAHEPLAQWRALNHNPDWTAIHLLQRGTRIAQNADACPTTMALLARLPQPDIPGASANAMFSLLAPRTTIPAHVGVNNTRLLCHLPLIVPQGCWFRVGAETRFWQEGQAFIFDDTCEHEAANPSDQLRVVLIFDIWHPDLTPPEQDAVRALIIAEGGQKGD